MNKSYKFSIVIAIYNMENYLVETMDSLVNQTIGFEDNLQILLVNDGSIDNSEEICKSYATKYPENIVYIGKENGGVSEARNKGLEYATGELVNFLDADDKLQNDALEKVYDFLKQNREEVDLISIPLYFFEAKEGEHSLNYKFTSTRVIDIFEEPKCFQMHISSSFIKLQEIKKYIFNTKLKLGEDAEVANKIILNKGKYGVVADTKYMYRRRNAGDSALQGAKENKENYIPPLKYLYLELIQFAKEKYNSVPAYLQWLIIYDIGGKIRMPHIESTVLDQSEIEEFIGYVKQVVSNIDDEIILGSSYLRRYYYLYLLKLKYNQIAKEKFSIISNNEDAVLCFNNHIVDMLYRQKVHVETIVFQENMLQLSGYFNFLFDQFDFKLVIDNNGLETELPFKINENYQITSLNQLVANGYDFNINIPFDYKDTTLKVKAILGKTKYQIQLLLNQDEFENQSKNSDSVVAGNFKISGKNKVLEIKKETVSTDENKSKISENNSGNNEFTKQVKIYLKNRMIPNCVNKVLSICSRKMLKGMIEKFNKSNAIIKKIPISYRYYILSNLKYNGDNDLKIATSFNQACLYNKDNLLLSKATDININLIKYKIENSQFSMKGTITSPFKANIYKLKCNCNKQNFNCELKRNNSKSLTLLGESILDCYEFEITIPLKEKNEISFEINIGLSSVLPQFNLNNVKFVKNAKKAGYMVNIEEKKKIEISC